MLLATYQPLERDESIQRGHYARLSERLGGEYPIFCIPARSSDELFLRSLTSAAYRPQRLYLLDTENFVRYDMIKWRNIDRAASRPADYDARFDEMFDDVDEKVAEYAVPISELDDYACSCKLKDLLEPDAFDEYPDWFREPMAVMQTTARRYFNKRYNAEFDMMVHDATLKGYSDFMMQETFIWVMSGLVYKLMADLELSDLDRIPYFPGLIDTGDLLDEIDFLRSDLIACEAVNASHGDYMRFVECVAEVVGRERNLILGKALGRNDPCICGSGKKYKNCHYRKPVDFFPFESASTNG